MSDRSPPGAAWSVARPSIEYQHAFDCCAVELNRTGGPVAVLASSPFYARELLKRVSGRDAWLVPTSGWHASSAGIEAHLGPEIDSSSVHWAPASDLGVSAAVWAEPERDRVEQTLASIQQRLAPDGPLCVVLAGWLARFLPERERRGSLPEFRPAGMRRTVGWMRRAGFRIEASYGFHGLVSIAWGYLARLLEYVGRADLADRCLYWMRAKYVVGGGARREPPCVW